MKLLDLIRLSRHLRPLTPPLSSTRRSASSSSRTTSTLPDLSLFPPSRIRNFAIIAHIDHGKSTLADRLLEITGTIQKKDGVALPGGGGGPGRGGPGNASQERNEQVLDTLKVERERGITVRTQSCSMFYTPPSSPSTTYLLNLLDTPGHVDFSSELLRSLLPSQGCILLVDASKGIQAQTLSVLSSARSKNLSIIPAVNKLDLLEEGDPRLGNCLSELSGLVGGTEEDVLRVSGKTGLGVEGVLEEVVKRIRPPEADVEGEDVRLLVFDSYFDSFRGVVSLVSVVEGSVGRGDPITSHHTKSKYTILDLGLLSPHEIPLKSGSRLTKGMVGWIVCGMKNPLDAHLGDTLFSSLVSTPPPPLESFEPLKSMVFAGIYPIENGGFGRLEESIRRLTLTDRSVTSTRESSQFLGQGFRLGFNGSLHMDVFKQRLEDEFGEQVVVTRPLVPVKLLYRDGTTKTIENPSEFPDPGGMLKVDKVLEPMIKATIVAPDEYTGAIINLCTSHRGVPLSHTYLSGTGSTTSTRALSTLIYSLPLSSIITNFHSLLKSLSSGFASFDYEELPDWERSDLVRMDLKVNGEFVDALTSVVHRSNVEKEGREWAKRLREVVERQQYEVVIQAAVGSTIIARERIAPVRKDVTAGLYGGDVTRKMKQLAKQRAGKKRLKERSIGNVTIPTSAFFTVLGGKEGKKKAT